MAQGDSLPYKLFKDKVVLYSDLGFASAPFSISYNFPGPVEKIKYKNNFRTVLGIGGAYKWFSLRLAFSLPGSMRAESLYGKTEQFNLGTDFTIKKTFVDLDIRSYKGYAIKDAYTWNDSLSPSKPNDILPKMNAASFSANVWYFHNPDFKMSAIRGRTGHYRGEVQTWYLKNTLNFFGVGNNLESVIPFELTDSLNSKTSSKLYTAIDLGVLPGYAYVNKINNWQFSGAFGFGPVIQGKFYEVNGITKGYLGLAPRYDLRLVGGYNVDRYFFMLVTDFDNKSIRFNKLKYRQSYYYIRLVAGIRLESKNKSKDPRPKDKNNDY